jgi:class 3 adenylate cyclase
VPASSPQRLAAEIPDARLVSLDGESVTSLQADPLMMASVDAFLLDGDAAGASLTGLPAGTAVILFVDIESSTALTERMGDGAFRTASRAIDEKIRAAVRESGGTPVEGKVMGDGVMSVFSSAAQAIAAAHACRELSAASELRLHIGLHAGDVIREENNVYGGAVNIASRVCDASTPGEILVSATVRDLARTSAGVAFEDRGERALKGIEEPVRVFAVLAQ